MLEKVDLTKKLTKQEYKQAFVPLQLRLAALQREALEAGIPVVVLFEGWEAAGKGTCINRLVQRLDPRGFKVFPISAPTEEERLRPFLWRFAVKMPRGGLIAVFDRSWYGRVLVERVERLVKPRIWRRAYDEILQFERQHADAGAVIVKFWLHISREEQKKRFKAITSDPALTWKVGKPERKEHRKYRDYEAAVEQMLERTSTAQAPWTIIEATSGRYARVKVLETLVDAIQRALDERKPAEAKAPAAAPKKRHTDKSSVLERVDLSQTLTKPEYSAALKPLQQELRQLEHRMYVERKGAVVVYEGWDAAGKGGNIKRMTEKLDPRGYEVIPIAAPTKEELAHHYLWRFWKHMPKAGHLTIFDRSWYGRVLVERVEGFASAAQWRRAYSEIADFEDQLLESGAVLLKFWLHIDPNEQLRRFQAREETPYKKHKITRDDFRNRERWGDYLAAVDEMVERTHTRQAPWILVPANDKRWARIEVLRAVCRALEGALEK